MKLSEITLNNGTDTNCTRTMMSATGLSADTELEFIEQVARCTGTGYRNSIYRVVGSDDAIIIKHNNGAPDNLSWDSVEVITGYFAERKAYGQVVGMLTRKYRIPFEVGLAIGTKEKLYPWFLAACAQLDHLTEDDKSDLRAGIARRKAGLQVALGQDLYDALDIDGMGQRNSSRIASYVLSRI